MIAFNPFTLRSKFKRCKKIEDNMHCTQTFMSKESAEKYRQEYYKLWYPLERGYYLYSLILTILFIVFFVLTPIFALGVRLGGMNTQAFFIFFGFALSIFLLFLNCIYHPFNKLNHPELMRPVSKADLLKLKDVSDTNVVKRFMAEIEKRDDGVNAFRFGQLVHLINAGNKELDEADISSILQKYEIKSSLES